ncbi:hypothetical protein J6590_048769 [Homalodisca vitripennis]|nr:hypothetical protein J6590_048769 [Homalodisca vitripennis]
MTAHFRNFEKFENSLGLYKRKTDLLKKKVCFRDGIKWIRVEEFGCYYFKESYDPNMPFRKVNLLRHDNQPQPDNITVPRYVNPRGSLTEDKINNLQEQMLFVKEQFRWFYEQVFKQQGENVRKKPKPSTRKKMK